MDNTVIQASISQIQTQFYKDLPLETFYRDRKMLIYAITWPATWMEQRGLATSQNNYIKLIRQRLQEVKTHGEPTKIKQYFPRYLLKCLQNWFQYHGDDLYEELKHVRNSIETLMDQISRLTHQKSYHEIEILVKAHQICAPPKTKKKTDPRQMTLF